MGKAPHGKDSMTEIRDRKFFGKPFKFACEPDHHASWWSFEDEEDVRLRWWHINPGDVVVDAGAAFGSYVFPALALGASKVIAWSPEGHKTLFELSTEANGWRDKIIFYDTGLWSSPGFLQVLEHEAMPRYFSALPDEWKEAMPPNAFPVETIDIVFARHQLDRADWLKIDVEGAEVEVLRGAEETLRKFKPRVLIENHLFKDASIKDRCASFLADLGVGYREVETIPYHSVSHSFYTAS